MSLAVLMGIFTGMNGFFMAASRLMFSMGRAKVLAFVGHRSAKCRREEGFLLRSLLLHVNVVEEVVYALVRQNLFVKQLMPQILL